MATTPTVTWTLNTIRNGDAPPVIFLHGEEGYFIDLISAEVEKQVAPDDRDFDLSLLYATETPPAAVVEAARRYPLMARRQVVILREIQAVRAPIAKGPADYLAALADYVANPSPSTILCLCFRGAKASAAKFLKALASANGIVLECKKLSDSDLQKYIEGFITSRGLTVDHDALRMLAEYVGSDLSRIDNEVTKLTVALGPRARVTPEAVERNIGISKSFTNFEFVSALARRDTEHVFRILRHFAGDPKNHPPQMLVVPIFNLFSDLLIAHYSPDKSDRGLLKALDKKWAGQLTDIKNAARWCGPWQTIEIISLLREFDSNSKGNGSRQNPFDLLHNLCFHILNPVGAAGMKW